MNRYSRFGVVTAAAAVAAAGVVGLAAPASADYGPTEVYQIELSVNIPGPQGGGMWMWWGLSSDGTGDYHGSDCGHGGVGATSDAGDVHWHFSTDGKQVIINETVLKGLDNYVTTVTIPAARGHYTGTDTTFETLPPFIPHGVGFAQLQVAP